MLPTPVTFASAVVLVLVAQSVCLARIIQFAGREWYVRYTYGGPGPNYFSDSTQSVWLDAEGLHLKIRKIGNTWHCAEVATLQPTQHGMHRFYIASRVDQLDRNVVAAPFLYKSDTQELDIEFSRWQNPSPQADNAQFVVQPYDAPGNLHTFPLALNGDYSTHYIDWQSASVHFKSFHGHYTEPPSAGYLIQDWTYSGPDNPPLTSAPGIHINLWLVAGSPPTDGQEAEFIIKSADLPPPPDLDNDGVLDFNDNCPNTVPAAQVDANGCPPLIYGDAERDGDVDRTDWDTFAECFSGPTVIAALSSCAAYDRDNDGDIDLNEFGIFQRCHSGENTPADPTCDD